MSINKDQLIKDEANKKLSLQNNDNSNNKDEMSSSSSAMAKSSSNSTLILAQNNTNNDVDAENALFEILLATSMATKQNDMFILSEAKIIMGPLNKMTKAIMNSNSYKNTLAIFSDTKKLDAFVEKATSHFQNPAKIEDFKEEIIKTASVCAKDLRQIEPVAKIEQFKEEIIKNASVCAKDLRQIEPVAKMFLDPKITGEKLMDFIENQSSDLLGRYDPEYYLELAQFLQKPDASKNLSKMIQYVVIKLLNTFPDCYDGLFKDEIVNKKFESIMDDDYKSLVTKINLRKEWLKKEFKSNDELMRELFDASETNLECGIDANKEKLQVSDFLKFTKNNLNLFKGQNGKTNLYKLAAMTDYLPFFSQAAVFLELKQKNIDVSGVSYHNMNKQLKFSSNGNLVNIVVLDKSLNFLENLSEAVKYAKAQKLDPKEHRTYMGASNLEEFIQFNYIESYVCLTNITDFNALSQFLKNNETLDAKTPIQDQIHKFDFAKFTNFKEFQETFMDCCQLKPEDLTNKALFDATTNQFHVIEASGKPDEVQHHFRSSIIKSETTDTNIATNKGTGKYGPNTYQEDTTVYFADDNRNPEVSDKNIIYGTYKALDKKSREENTRNVGSCMLAATVRETPHKDGSKTVQRTIANIGDSRAVDIIIDETNKTVTVKRLTKDQKPNNFLEKLRIKINGGSIFESRVSTGKAGIENNKVLASSRHIGAQDESIWLYAEADIIESIIKLQKGEIQELALCCDGIWDNMNENDASELLSYITFKKPLTSDKFKNKIEFEKCLDQLKGQTLAEQLMNCAHLLGSTDNLTVVICREGYNVVNDGHGGKQVSQFLADNSQAAFKAAAEDEESKLTASNTISQIKSDEFFKGEGERVYIEVGDLRPDSRKNEVSFKSGNWYKNLSKQVSDPNVSNNSGKLEVQ